MSRLQPRANEGSPHGGHEELVEARTILMYASPFGATAKMFEARRRQRQVTRVAARIGS